MSLEEETAKKIIRQVEFYFSDTNLPSDSFLKKTISESEDGMISLALICSFSGMSGHLGLGDVKPEYVSEDTVKAVAETLRTSTFLKVSGDGKKVGRVTELAKPGAVIEQLDDRTIAASPVEYDVKLEDVESFFTQYAKVNSVTLARRVAGDRSFCSTVLVEFSSAEDAASILNQTFTYSGVELGLKPKKDFDAHRAKQEEDLKMNRSQRGSNQRDKANVEPEYSKGLIVAFKLERGDSGKDNDHQSASCGAVTSGEDGEQDVAKGNFEETKEEALENAGEGEEIEADKTSEPETEEPEAAEESLDIAGYTGNKNVVTREDLERIFQKFGIVKIGSESGYVRFEDDAAAQKAHAAAVLTKDGGLIVKNFIATRTLSQVRPRRSIGVYYVTIKRSVVMTSRAILEGRLQTLLHGSLPMEQKREGKEIAVAEILSRLPIKSIGRFMLVSKHWRGMITSRRFSLLYAKNNPFYTFFSTSPPPLLGFRQSSIIEVFEKGDSVKTDFRTSNSVRISFRARDLDSGSCILIVGSCNGLLCLVERRMGFDNVIILNPVTNETTRINHSIYDCKSREVHYRFGYSPSTNEYKVFRCFTTVGNARGFRGYEIITIGVDKRWRKLSPHLFPNYMRHGGSPLLPSCRGAFHWLGASRYSRYNFIVAFDIAQENTRRIPIPQADKRYLRLLVSNDPLCLYYRKDQANIIWKMDDDGDHWSQIMVPNRAFVHYEYGDYKVNYSESLHYEG